MILKCDFCSVEQEEETFHRHRAQSFELEPEISGLHCTSEGDWAACDVCDIMIKHEEWDKLAERSARLLDPHGDMPFNLLVKEVKELHEQFRRARL